MKLDILSNLDNDSVWISCMKNKIKFIIGF